MSSVCSVVSMAESSTDTDPYVTAESQESDCEANMLNTPEAHKDKSQFLNATHGKFLELVNPIDSGLIDEFRQTYAMSSDEEQLIRAEPTRRDKARKTWMLLKHLPPKRFMESCYPAIKAKYPHVLEGRELFWDDDGVGEEQCIRHALMDRMRLRRFADLFPPGDGCSQGEYRIVVECGNLDPRWSLAFNICSRPINRNNKDFVRNLKETLTRFEVNVPENFEDLLKDGFPCTCQGNTQDAAVKRQNKRSKESVSFDDVSSGYPSTMDDLRDDVTSELPSSHETTDNLAEEFPDEEKLLFDTEQTKEKFLEDIDKISEAIKCVSSIKTLCSDLVGIHERSKFVAAGTKSESSNQICRRFTEVKKILRKAKDVNVVMLKDYDIAKNINQDADCGRVLTNLPLAAERVLLKQRQRLRDGMLEVTPLVKAAQTTMVAIDRLKTVLAHDYCKSFDTVVVVLGGRRSLDQNTKQQDNWPFQALRHMESVKRWRLRVKQAST